MENNDSGILIVVYVVDLNLLMGRYFFFYCAWKFQAGRRTGRTIRPAAPDAFHNMKYESTISI